MPVIATSAAPSRIRAADALRPGRVTHARMSGVTSRIPIASPPHQVNHAGGDRARRHDSGNDSSPATPIVALTIGADDRAEDRQGEHVARALERRDRSSLTRLQERRRDDRLQRIADGGEPRDGDRRIGGRVRDERADGHTGPDASAEEQHRRDGDAGRWPDERDGHADRRERQPELGREEVGDRHAAVPRHVGPSECHRVA